MYHIVEARIRAALGEFLSRRGIQDIAAVTQRPPNVAMGEVATPIAFELAKRLRRAPRQIAQEIAAELAAIPGVARVELAGAGYVNFFFDRAAFFRAAFSEATNAGLRRGSDAGQPARRPASPRYVVEHTNINPNKAAHIGHLRNAALGDTFVRLLRRAGRRVEVQNYIDNTGVQVADVVVALPLIWRKSPPKKFARWPRRRASITSAGTSMRGSRNFSRRTRARLALRGQTLAAIEEGHGRGGRTGGDHFRGDRRAAICAPWSGSACNTTCCRARAKSCT